MKNWPQTVLSQYSSSATITALLESIDEWISPDANFEQFYDTVWNLDSAQSWGLDVWGRIVVAPRIVTLTGLNYWGFGEAGDREPFSFGPFGDYYQTSTDNFVLTDDTYRQFILAKAAYNITDGSIPAINAILMNLFPGRGNAYVVDGGGIPPITSFGFGEAGDRLPFGQGAFGDYISYTTTRMTLTYRFEFPLQPFEAAMVQSGVLPRPTGVLALWDFAAGVMV